MKTVIKIFEWFGMVVVVISILLVAFVFIGPRLGWETHPVLSGSMEPTLKVGGLIITKPENIQDIKENDMITFNVSSGVMVTHRVVGVEIREGKPWFQTKGDANNEPDNDYVSSEGDKMRKVVFHIPYLGFAAVFLQRKITFFILIAIPALILIGIFSRDIWKGIKEIKEKKKPAVSDSGKDYKKDK